MPKKKEETLEGVIDMHVEDAEQEANHETETQAGLEAEPAAGDHDSLSEICQTDPETSENASDPELNSHFEPKPESVLQNGAEVQPAAPARSARRRGVVSIDGQRSELTAEARRRQDLIDLSESMKSGRVLSGVIAGVERPADNPNSAYAVIYHGAFKIIIPADEMFELDEETAENYRGAMLSRRLGAEVDYVVKGIEAEAGIAAASRVAAMAQRRREYFLNTDREGRHVLEEGDIAEARVVSVIRTGAFIELFGIEQFVPTNELSYLRWADATMHFRVGERVLVKLISIDRSDRSNIKLSLSVKQAGEDTFRQAISRFRVGNIYVGTVTMITAVGVFVSFENVSCLCQFPKRKRPAIGSQVTVRILGASLTELRLWGVIVYA